LALILGYLKELKEEASKNRPIIVKGLKHHVHYNFNVLDVIEEAVDNSLISI